MHKRETPFSEREPVVETTPRPPAGQPRSRVARLPASGPGTIRVSLVGQRLILKPSDARADLMLRGASAQLGTHYDRKRDTYVTHFPEALKRGPYEFESFLVLAAFVGLRLELPASTRIAIDRYRRRLLRQLRPIERVIWTDPDAPTSSLVEWTEVKRGVSLEGAPRIPQWTK